MKKIKKIKDGFISRNGSLLKYALRTGTSIIKNKDDPKKILEDIMGTNVTKFVSELSHYKGSITKAGQLLSQYGELFFDKKINDKLKIIQNSTHFLDFEDIKSNLSQKAINDLIIEKDPIAAASIGQIHKAKVKDTNQECIMKIQYKGIEKAIEYDLYFIKMLTKAVGIFPKTLDTKSIFIEIEKILKMEMDYERELAVQSKYKSLISDDSLHVPDVYKSYSSQKSICMEYIDGIALSSIDDLTPTQINRNFIGEKIFDLFLKELYEFNLIQTDAHGGNYYVSKDLKKIYLLDFGACIDFEEEIISFYRNFIKFAYLDSRDNFFDEFDRFILYWGEEFNYDKDSMWKYIQLLSSPLRSENYNWNDQNFTQKLYDEGKNLRETIEIKTVPHFFIFLDRKLLGLYSLMNGLKAAFNVKKCMERNIRV